MLTAKENSTKDEVHSYIDESFDKAFSNDYQLFVQLCVDAVIFAVKEKQKNRFVGLEKIPLPEIYSLNDLVGKWDELMDGSKLASGKYSSTECIIVSNLSTLVPEPFFEEGREKEYLQFNVALGWNDVVMVNTIPIIDTRNVFALPFELKAKIDYSFNSVSYTHYSTPLIASLIQENKNKSGNDFYVHVADAHLEVILHHGKKLLFYNTFNYQADEDLIYYLLFVCEQLHLNPEKIALKVLGEVDKKSSVIQLIKKYVNTLIFVERSEDIGLSYQLQSLPKHFYYTLFNNYNHQISNK